MRVVIWDVTGGVATLNHRLMAENPFGMARYGRKDVRYNKGNALGRNQIKSSPEGAGYSFRPMMVIGLRQESNGFEFDLNLTARWNRERNANATFRSPL